MRSTESVKRTSRTGRGDPAVLDEERAVAGHAGQQRLLLVDDVDVPEARHVEPALDRGRELRLVGRAAADQHEVRRVRAEAGAARRGRVPGRRARRRPPAPPSACRARRGGRRRPGSAAAAPSARPRGRTRAAGCAGTAASRVRLIDGAATRWPRRPHERAAALGVGEAVEREVAEEVEQLADRLGLEDDGVLAGRRGRPAPRGETLPRPRARDRRRVDRAAPRPPASEPQPLRPRSSRAMTFM